MNLCHTMLVDCRLTTSLQSFQTQEIHNTKCDSRCPGCSGDNSM